MTAQQGTTHSGSRTWGECGRDHGLSLSTPDLLEVLRCKIAGAPGELLRPQHIDYCLGWAAAVNPEGAPITTMYCGIGADLCTVLLSTNPAHIIGVDQQPVELSKFKRLIQLWEALDCDPCQIKSVAPIPGLGCEDIDKLLLEVDLGYRRIHGFWDMDSLRKYGLEWCALIELRKLGVQMKSIEVLASREGPLLSFEKR
ncbi:MAG: hypothetical protein DCC75_09590 [Proteobacteria bacterium]|nr:MAG: hypothetical protein DCC75_09590 [Pseudomonadota bacterium]